MAGGVAGLDVGQILMFLNSRVTSEEDVKGVCTQQLVKSDWDSLLISVNIYRQIQARDGRGCADQ